MNPRLMISRLLAATLLGIPFSMVPSEARGALVLDQEQTSYDSGMSARTLPGYTIWQSFTAGSTGTLAEVDMGFFNTIHGDATLRLYSGEGTGGTLLQTLAVPISSTTQAEASWNQWSVDVAVSAGSMYTFEITPDSATMPDPYGLALGLSNTYSGGHLGLNDPSGSYLTDFDALFRTYISSDPAAPGGPILSPHSPSPVPEPCSIALAGLGALGLLGYVRGHRRIRSPRGTDA